MAIMRSFGQTARAYTIFKDARLRQYSLSGHQSLYLRAVCRNPGITQEELAEKMVFNKSSVSRQIACMVKAGLLRQEKDPRDKRSTKIFATERGEALLPTIIEVSHDFFERITEDFTPEEKAMLDALAQKVCKNAREVIRNK